jgi:large subunit ribosomal protein L4
MASLEVVTASGAAAGSAEVADEWFAISPNVPVMHQVVVAQLAAARAGTQSTKTRTEVRGGGRKPWRQKGTGRARQGSTRSPQWVGGGVALGPKPRSYAQRTPKKMIQLALRSALSDRASEGNIRVVDAWEWETPKTKEAVAALTTLGLNDTKVLMVLGDDDHVAAKAFGNLPAVQLIHAAELNAYDVLCNDVIVFTRQTLPAQAPTTEVAEPTKKKSSKAPVEEPEAAEASAEVAPETSESDEN